MAEKLYGNRWQIIEQIGEGGQGFVYKVQDITDKGTNYFLKRLRNSNDWLTNYSLRMLELD